LPREASLTDPRAKIERAAEHLDALGAELRAFSDRDPHGISADAELDKGRQVLRFREREKPPIKLGLIFGDFIHNLRSALDSLVCQLAYLNGAESCDRTQFPICGTAEQFAEQVKRRRLAGLRSDHIASIETLQPYEGRYLDAQLALVVVRDFDNIDKHQAIHAAATALDPRPEAMGAWREVPEGDIELEIEPVTVGQPLYDGAIIARVRLIGGTLKPNMGMEIEFPLRIGFGEFGLASDKLPTVWREIGGIIESFAPAFELG
jgi:hypothetical protein